MENERKDYLVLSHRYGLEIREHNFEKAKDGGYLFTQEEARKIILSSGLDFPIAVQADYLKNILPTLFPEKRTSEKSGIETATQPTTP